MKQINAISRVSGMIVYEVCQIICIRHIIKMKTTFTRAMTVIPRNTPIPSYYTKIFIMKFEVINYNFMVFTKSLS